MIYGNCLAPNIYFHFNAILDRKLEIDANGS
jgi:hypothetical protein